jgi:hypothetical protein
MKRFNIFSAAVIVALGVSIVSAQETTTTTPTGSNENTTSENPVADLTARIMQEFFPNSPLEAMTPAADVQDQLQSRITSAAGNWSNLQSLQNLQRLQGFGAERLDSILPETNKTLEEIEQRMQQLKSRFPGIAQHGPFSARSAAAMAQSAMARSTSVQSTASTSSPSTATAQSFSQAPQAIAVSVANGLYSIEAVVDVENGPQKVQLNGTRAEVQEQIRQLDPTIREALGVRLGL